MTIKAALPRGPQEAREHELGDGTARRPIAAATHLARHDRPADRVLGAVVGRIDFQIKQAGEQRGPLAVEVYDKPLNGSHRRPLAQQNRQAMDQAAASDGGAVGRDGADDATVSDVENLLEDLLDLPRQERARMILLQLASSSDQVREARLMGRFDKLPIRRPAVADQDAGEGGAEETGGFLKAAARQDHIHGRRRCHTDPQPLQLGLDSPAGFIGHNHGTGPHRLDRAA